HGKFFPLYFESSGDYKAPIYIYAVAAAFKLFGPSTLALRATSAFFFGLLLSAIVVLEYRRTHSRYMTVFVLLAGGFLPWFFTLSRISLEIISYVALVAWAVCFQFIAFHDTNTKQINIFAALCGVFLGLSTYAYPTGRITSFIYLVVIIAIAARQHKWRSLAYLLLAFSIAIVPYTVYAFTSSANLLKRFRDISYVFDRHMGLMDKLALFIGNYGKHFSPSFLLLHGDHNLRHATGEGG